MTLTLTLTLTLNPIGGGRYVLRLDQRLRACFSAETHALWALLLGLASDQLPPVRHVLLRQAEAQLSRPDAPKAGRLVNPELPSPPGGLLWILAEERR